MAQLRLVIGILSFMTVELTAQSPCQQNYFSVLGSVIEDEVGYCIAVSPDQSTLYLAGIREDSALILKFDAAGKLSWTRSFAFVPGVANHAYGIIVDSEGKIVVSGFAGVQTSGGSIFVARYDPDLNAVLWCKKLTSGSNNFNLGLIEMAPGGDFLLSNNPSAPNVAELIRIERLTGKIISSFSKWYDLGSSETIADFAIVNGRLFGCGRFSDGPSVNEMRNTIMELDINNGDVIWMKLGHKPASTSARLYGLDIISVNNNLFSLYIGDENGGSLSNTNLYIQKTSLNGQLLWLKRFNLPGSNDWGDELIESDGGLVIMAHQRVPPSDLILFKIDYDGHFLWGKKYDYALNDNGISFSGAMSQLISVDQNLFFTGFAEQAGNSDLLIIKTDLEGNIKDTCSSVADVDIPSSDVLNPVFYSRTPIVSQVTPTVSDLAIMAGQPTSIEVHPICTSVNTISTSVQRTICNGDTAEGYSQTGIYSDTLDSVLGCDSIRVLELTVLPEISSTMSVQICDGEVFEGYGQSGMYTDTFLASNGCDSIRTLFLTVAVKMLTSLDAEICEGESMEGYTMSGTYIDTLTTASGCDSVRELILNVLQTSFSNFTVQICDGEIYEGYGQSGTYVDTFVAGNGCDSIRTLFLAVAANVLTTIQAEICQGESVEGYTASGMYTDTFITVLGCDSIRILNLTVLPVSTSTQTIEICEGDDFEGHNQSGTYTDTLISANGCDSIRTIFLTVSTSISSSVEAEICQGESAEGYTITGSYVDTLMSVFGCDSIRTLNLTVLSGKQSWTDVQLCPGDMMEGYTQEGIFTDTLLASNGCDSIRTLSIELLPEKTSVIHEQGCIELVSPEDDLNEVYLDTLQASNGCDSIITVIVDGYRVFIPNIFSPNADGINDYFEVIPFPGEPGQLSFFQIFDRFGNLVYSTSTWPVKWDGKDKGGCYFNPGVFTYVLKYKCGENVTVQYGGDVTLVR